MLLQKAIDFFNLLHSNILNPIPPPIPAQVNAILYLVFNLFDHLGLILPFDE